jgi:hypothetical protein
MKELAKSVVEALAFLELGDATDIEEADRLKETIGANLRRASAEEKNAVREAVEAAYNAANEAEDPEEVIDFYETFFETFIDEE